MSAPRASIHILPPELKSRIAKHCAEQDQRHLELRELFDEQMEDIMDGPPLDHLLEGLDRRYSRSLAALFRVSVEWSEIAAPYRFRTFQPSERQLDNLTFSYRILPTRAHLFQVLDLRYVSRDRLRTLFPLLAHFTGVQSIHFGQAVGDIVDRHTSLRLPISADELAHVRGLFGCLLAQARTVDAEVSLSLVQQVVRAAPNTRALCVDTYKLLRSPAADGSTLFDVIATLPDLQELQLRAAALSWEASVAALGWPRAPLPPLRQLRLVLAKLKQDILDMVASAASSFESLSIRGVVAEDLEPLTLFRTPFSRLRELELAGSSSLVLSLISGATVAYLPVLRRLQLECANLRFPDYPGDTWTNPVTKHLTALVRTPSGDPHPTLQTVTLFDPITPCTTFLESLLRTPPPHLPPTVELRTATMRPWPAEAVLRPRLPMLLDPAADAQVERDVFAAAVRRTAGFLADWVERVDAQEREGVADEVVQGERLRIAQLLDAVELERVAMEL
ncbi:hypothetical protein JCM10450v2_008252 [Rhodotorula kratochvilovae]